MSDRGDRNSKAPTHESAGDAHRFFFTRKSVDFGHIFHGDAPGLLSYANVPRAVGVVISSGLASLTELSTTLGTEDLYDLVEIVMVDAHNRRMLEERARDGY